MGETHLRQISLKKQTLFEDYCIWATGKTPLQAAVIVAVPYARFDVAFSYARQASFKGNLPAAHVATLL
jgi:acyl CoA:acetate/3-ketoacid CoA transferase alpha subunit